MRTRKPDVAITLEDLRKIVAEHKEQGRNLVKELRTLLSHADKMYEYYEEWEARLNSIQNSINELSEEHGVIDLEDYDMVGDLLGGSDD